MSGGWSYLILWTGHKRCTEMPVQYLFGVESFETNLAFEDWNLRLVLDPSEERFPPGESESPLQGHLSCPNTLNQGSYGDLSERDSAIKTNVS